MTNKEKATFKPVVIVIGIVAIVVGISVSVMQLILPDSDERNPDPDQKVTVEALPNEADIQDERLKVEEPSSFPVNESREMLAPEGFFIKGYVRDKDTNEDILVYDMEIIRKVENGANGEWDSIIHETVKTDTAFFNYPLHRPGVYSITVRSSRYKKHITEDFILTEKDRIKELVIYLESGYRIRGVVVDDATGNPVEGARVFPLSEKGQNPFLWLLRGFEQYTIAATTNAEGEFLLSGLDRKEVLVVATHPHYAESYVDAEPESGDFIELRMKRGPIIYGKAFDDDGNPASNLLITVMGFQLPVPLCVLTNKDGGFRTAPLRPGRVVVRASALSTKKGNERSSAFTTETLMVTIIDKDEEVIFGPSPDKVTWRGHLYKKSGEPVRGGMVEVSPTSDKGKKEAYYFKARSTALCDEEGMFEFIKLVTGSYRVRVYFPNRYLHFDWGEIKLDEPGLIEKDIHLSGGEIHGMVVDELTGRPVQGVEGVINASLSKPKYKSYTAVLDENGGFHFYGLLSGDYQLTPAVEGSLKRSHPCIVRENEVVKNFKLSITYGGRLVLRLREFDTTENSQFNMSVRRLDGVEDDGKNLKGKDWDKGKGWREGDPDTADWETELTLEPGEYELELDFLSFGIVKRPFEVFPGQTTFVEIFRYELGPAAEVFDINAILQYQDGMPLDGAYVRIMTNEGPWEVMGKTDSEGRVTLKGIRPGTWRMDVWIVDSTSKSGITCPDLVFVEESEPPDPLVIVISVGIIRGEILDASTGRVLGENAEYWSAVLKDVKTQKTITQSYGGSELSELNLIGINEGEYQLIISAKGYRDFNSDTISLGENQILDLGRIELEPEESQYR